MQMKKWLGKFWPQKLKYRLFMAFVLLILLPFCVLTVYNYGKIETIIQDEVSQQSHAQLENLNRSLQDQMSIAFRSVLFLEQDSAVRATLKNPEQFHKLDNISLMEEKFRGLNTSFFLLHPTVYFTVLDLKGNVYTSNLPKETLNYETILANPRFQESLKGEVKYTWVPRDVNHVFRDTSASPYLLSLYAVMREPDNRPYGLVRISIDYTYWFQSVRYSSSGNQPYFIITGKGEPVAQSVASSALPDPIVQKVTAKPEKGYILDEPSQALINFSYIESLDWYIVTIIPFDLLFNKIQALKHNYYITYSLFMAAFILIALMISFTVTRPLSHIQMKMREAVRHDLKIRLPEDPYKGEILELSRTFNTMLSDMGELIQRLKVEQREKDAVQFQMLLAQMNPHFLLNTLNTMKWIALRKEQADIAEICMSLGKLLETSLNADMELIYLKDEMDLIRAYIYIQRTRYKDRFEVHYEYDERDEYVLVPKLSLQPLVENAIQHGIAGRPQGGVIRIRIKGAGHEALVLEVEDNGLGVEKAKQLRKNRTRPGIGLENIRQRLRLLFKDKGALEIIPRAEGTLVRITLPYLLAVPYEKGGDPDVESDDRRG
ncbi:hypothetical protein PAECIP111802_03518 [Paenibacillus allorhizosphaerae]|uniref:Histidine kinase n=2 Tax=Paenibacillus allorhizosphaerae TaxID=2849866 RepID=A0ABM8VJG3_9BACL|nr:hypothetical protein PAECIP111802_03518 [Paenibacillus allorhizosphaerae]